MKRLVIIAAACVAGPAAAQSWSTPGFAISPAESMSMQLQQPLGTFLGSNETPAMRRQQVARALALRDEALRLQAENGGTLSREQLAVIQRKADKILHRPSGNADRR